MRRGMQGKEGRKEGKEDGEERIDENRRWKREKGANRGLKKVGD